MIKNKNLRKVLIDEDLTIKGLAQKTGYTRGYLSSVLNGHKQSPRAEKLISFVLGRAHSELWPDHQTGK
ncbi:MAG: helix-turn-helix domain-containing protein [Deltaproteobacteria bacterium]|nr:helix-turn-helix domain-containing protein [Deltaproteobacteria bacterium]